MIDHRVNGITRCQASGGCSQFFAERLIFEKFGYRGQKFCIIRSIDEKRGWLALTGEDLPQHRKIRRYGRYARAGRLDGRQAECFRLRGKYKDIETGEEYADVVGRQFPHEMDSLRYADLRGQQFKP